MHEAKLDNEKQRTLVIYFSLFILFILTNIIILFLYNKIIGIPSKRKYYFNKYKADSIIFTLIVLVSLPITIIIYQNSIHLLYENQDELLHERVLHEKLLLVDKSIDNDKIKNSFNEIKQHINYQNNERKYLYEKINILKIELEKMENEINNISINTKFNHEQILLSSIYDNIISFAFGILGSIIAAMFYTTYRKNQ